MKHAILLLIVSIMTFTACKSDSNGDSEESKVILNELANTGASPEVQEYFLRFSEVIDAYVSMIEEMAEAQSKSNDDFKGAMDMLGSVSKGLMEIAPLVERMDELEKEAEILQENMSAEELQAFLIVYEKMISRFMEASEKLNSIQ